jgi:UDP-N-acetylglucosamine--N-acetylmuramyl-(pentapeptide) pyrophosphoryl-undecaprenol N-acetylglucosamine transferase
MNVVIAAGGTGGHFYPGLAVALELIARGDNVRFILRKNDYVIPLVQKEAIPYREIYSAGLRRSLSPQNLLVPFKLVIGFIQCVLFFLSKRPAVVLVMGGYLSVPAALAANLLGIPVLLHEQNVHPGMANRLIGRLSKSIAVSFESSRSFFNGDVVLTGNPVRTIFKTLPSPSAARQTFGLDSDTPTVFVFGGSLGAHKLNQWVLDCFTRRPDLAKKFQVLNVTGPKDAAEMTAAYRKLGIRHKVMDFCHDMPRAYAAADMVVARAGASTVTELLAVKRPALLVPYPFATDNHQKANAEVLVRLGAAAMFEEKGKTSEEFTEALTGLLNAETISAMAENYSKSTLDPYAAVKNIAALLDQFRAK